MPVKRNAACATKIQAGIDRQARDPGGHGGDAASAGQIGISFDRQAVRERRRSRSLFPAAIGLSLRNGAHTACSPQVSDLAIRQAPSVGRSERLIKDQTAGTCGHDR